jgi:uncharacterized protein (DUF169 family)
MEYTALSNEISALLDLDSPVIGLSFVDAPPEGVNRFEGVVPSACTFWRRAEDGVFYASGEQHGTHCPIGAMTMGFELPSNVQENLMSVVGLMCECGYIGGDEPQAIPTVKRKSSGIVYGPLADLPLEPDVLLMWVTPRQAMFFNEAAGTVEWGGSMPKGLTGRPTCAAIPLAMETGKAGTSTGCIGMRTFTEISDDRLLAVVPGEKAEEFVAGLRRAAAANARMVTAYEELKADALSA